MTIPAVQAGLTNPDQLTNRPARPGRSEPPAESRSPYVNPTLRLNTELGLVVMEFRDDSGALTTTIPSERQIEAYRAHQETMPMEKNRLGDPSPVREEEHPTSSDAA